MRARRDDAAAAQAATGRAGESLRTSPDRARSLAARALDDAMEACEVSGRALAVHLCVTEAVVRRMRSGERPVSAGTILRMPAALRAEYLARLASAADAPPAAPTREARALAVLGAAGAVSHELADAMADGVVTSEEVERAAPALARLLRTLDALRRPVGEA